MSRFDEFWYERKRELFESNYGSLEKDERLLQLRKILCDNIVNVLKRNLDPFQWKGNILQNIGTKYKSNSNKELKINWNLQIKDVGNQTGLSFLFDETNTNFTESGKINITFVVKRMQKEASIGKFRDKVIDFFEDESLSNMDILHELKHILDYIDGIWGDKFFTNYISPTENEVKYHTQNAERHNFLITAIQELKNIKEKQPNITLEKALEQNFSYQDMIERLTGRDLNRFKQKVVYFWNQNYNKIKEN